MESIDLTLNLIRRDLMLIYLAAPPTSPRDKTNLHMLIYYLPIRYNWHAPTNELWQYAINIFSNEFK